MYLITSCKRRNWLNAPRPRPAGTWLPPAPAPTPGRAPLGRFPLGVSLSALPPAPSSLPAPLLTVRCATQEGGTSVRIDQQLQPEHLQHFDDMNTSASKCPVWFVKRSVILIRSKCYLNARPREHRPSLHEDVGLASGDCPTPCQRNPVHRADFSTHFLVGQSSEGGAPRCAELLRVLDRTTSVVCSTYERLGADDL